jgi:hypothetical protein
MTDDRLSRIIRALGVIVGGGFLVLGTAELFTRLDEPLVLLFWLPTLWGGGALVLIGVFSLAERPSLPLTFVIIGAGLGTLASFWTIVMPLLALALIMFAIKRNNRVPLASAD